MILQRKKSILSCYDFSKLLLLSEKFGIACHLKFRGSLIQTWLFQLTAL